MEDPQLLLQLDLDHRKYERRKSKHTDSENSNSRSEDSSSESSWLEEQKVEPINPEKIHNCHPTDIVIHKPSSLKAHANHPPHHRPEPLKISGEEPLEMASFSTNFGSNPGEKTPSGAQAGSPAQTFAQFSSRWFQFVYLFERCDYEKASDVYKELAEMESRPFQFLFEERNIVLYKMQRIRRRGLLAELIAQEIKKTLVGFEARYAWQMIHNGSNYSLSSAEDDEDSLVRLDAVFPISISKFFSLFHNVDAITEWCSIVKVAVDLEEIEKGSKAAYFTMKMPFMIPDRELFALITAVNRLDTDGSLLLLWIPFTHAPDKAKIMEIDITSPNNLAPLNVNTLLFEIVPITESKFKLKAVCHLNPNIGFVGRKLNKCIAKKCALNLLEGLVRACATYSENKWSLLREEDSDYYEWVDLTVNEYLTARKQSA